MTEILWRSTHFVERYGTDQKPNYFKDQSFAYELLCGVTRNDLSFLDDTARSSGWHVYGVVGREKSARFTVA